MAREIIETKVNLPGEATIDIAVHAKGLIIVGSTSAARSKRNPGFRIIVESHPIWGSYTPTQQLIDQICQQVQSKYAPIAQQTIQTEDRAERRALIAQAREILANIARDTSEAINS